MAFNTQTYDQVKIVLGDEFDDVLRSKLMAALSQLGAVSTGSVDRFVVGSQEIEELEVLVDGRRIRVEAETYIGLSIIGPSDLVQQVQNLLATKAAH